MSEPRVRVEDAIPDKYMSERRARATGATRRGETWRYDWDPVGTRQRGRMAMPMAQVLEEVGQRYGAQAKADDQPAENPIGTSYRQAPSLPNFADRETIDTNQEMGDALMSWFGRAGFISLLAAIMIALVWSVAGDSAGVAAVFVFGALALWLMFR